MESKSMKDLLDIMDILISEEKGCEWVRQQDFKSLKRYVIEEANEVIAAVDQNDDRALLDELGDLLLQVVFYAAVAQRDKKFTFEDVVFAICKKLRRRNAHIFDKDIAKQYASHPDKSAFACEQWERIKRLEKEGKI